MRRYVPLCRNTHKSIGRDKCNCSILTNVDFSAAVDSANKHNVLAQRDIVQRRKHGTEPIAFFGKMEFTMCFQIDIRRISAEQLDIQFLFEIHRPVNEDRDFSKCNICLQSKFPAYVDLIEGVPPGDSA